MIPLYNNYYMFMPFLPPNCQKPPTLYAVLNSIVNGMKEEEDYTKIRNLAKEGRTKIFDFYYPLTNNVSKETFETTILNHFLQRRIGFETVTAFKIQLEVKLNEIMPLYNKMFDLLEENNFFGEITSREGFDNRTTENENNTSNTLENKSKTTTKDISDRRNSELPQNQLEDLRNGSYVTNYNYDTNNNEGEDNSTSKGTSNAKNSGKDNNVYKETISRIDMLELLKNYNENIKNIYTLIFKDLDSLFYQIV